MKFSRELLLSHSSETVMPEWRIAELSRFYFGIFEQYGYDGKENAEARENLARYFGQYFADWSDERKSAKYGRPKRGLFLFGTPGTGKSFAMKIFSSVFGIEYISASDMMIWYETGGGNAFWNGADSYKGEDLIIDDIGNEREIQSFGNKTPMPDFIDKRFRLWENKGILTFYTSNLATNKEIRKRYGEVIFSRMYMSSEFVRFKGNDRRLKR